MRGHTVFWQLVVLSMKAETLKEHLSIGLFEKRTLRKNLLKIFPLLL